MIFLSASIPLENRDPKYYESADLIAIRDSVRALATVVIPRTHLIWGGHPSITPLIRYVIDRVQSDVKDHVTLYQSNFFKDFFPEDNFNFENIVTIQEAQDRDASLYAMRVEMLKDKEFKAGIFIGGMEGVEDEYKMFKELYPGALILPIASTGAAAKIIYDRWENNRDVRLETDYAYMSLFTSLLNQYL